MFDDTTGMVAFAMHEDRLRWAMANRRVREAARGRRVRRDGERGGSVRVRVAQGLVALAERIAPTVMMPRTGTQALGW
jgi:hypothetical protein